MQHDRGLLPFYCSINNNNITAQPASPSLPLNI